MIYTSAAWPDETITGIDVLARPRGRRRGDYKRRYLNVIAAFDIETTNIAESYAVMWIWQLQIGLDTTIIGRSWGEFRRCMQRISALMPADVYMVVYVHNLAFEFQFLRGVYDFKSDEVFAVSNRKPLRADMFGCIELRCSYLHTNMRLETFLDKMGVENKKLTMDYSKPRYPWTTLTDDEIAYCVNDVKGLVQALYVEQAHDGDSLYTTPLTSTGYVRRDVRRAMQKMPFGYVYSMRPDLDTYHLMREAFRGGNTHANRYYAKVLLPEVYSMDMASEYPGVQLNKPMPVSRFSHISPERCSFAKLEDLIRRRKKAVLTRIALWDVELSDRFWGAPYIPIDKCRGLKGCQADNGRVLSARYLEITITDIDLDIIKSEYRWSAIKVLSIAYARYGMLPEPLKAEIRRYFELKTKLKGDDDHAILYEKSKNKLNSIYGMSAQNPVKRNIIYSGEWSIESKRDDELLAEAFELGVDPDEIQEVGRENLEEYILLHKANKRSFFPYAWGVWTTAHARSLLEEGIRHVCETEGADFVYCDTDSVKYMGKVDWSTLNEERARLSSSNGAFADDKDGRRHYMLVFEPDRGYPAMFATRGAKKYCAVIGGKVKATIAGVSARDDDSHCSGGRELEEAGGIERFLDDKFTFHRAAAPKLLYNDTDRFMIRVEGRRLKIRECVSIRSNTYVLSDTPQYTDLLSGLTRGELSEFLWDAYGKRV